MRNLILLLCAGCSSGSLLVVSVDANAPVADVARLHATITQGSHMREVDVPLAQKSIPPAHTFGITFSSSGPVTVQLDAFDGAGAKIASVSGQADVGSGRSELALRFGIDPGDLATPDGGGDGGSDGAVDLAATDSAGGDLGGEDAALSCDPGRHACGATCIADDSPDGCGSSCTPCPLPANGNHATCDGTTCGFECNAGFHDCGGACVANSDVASCGGSCIACDIPPHASASTCDGTSCGFNCAAGYHECGGGCVRADDPATCGTSCTPCSAPGGGGTATCDGTQCGATCPGGTKLCLGACIPSGNSCNGSCGSGTHDCSGLCSSDNSTNSCGAACVPCAVPANSAAVTCDGTSCGFTCKAGYHKCGLSCLSDTDVGSCGASCSACVAGPANSTPICAAGSCNWQCNANFKKCGAACIPSSNCCSDGDCTSGANVMSASCISGSCQVVSCSGSFANCDSSYASGCEANTNNSDGQTNTPSANNINHCGGCGGTCPLLGGTSVTSCAAGACSIGSCSAGKANCDGLTGNGCEADLTNSDGQSGAAINHCGSCSGTCPVPPQAAGSSCGGSACHITSCSSGFLDCDGNFANGCEVNNGADNNNCLTCGNVCAANAFCNAGSCTAFKRVFVTSTSYDGNLGGPAGADAKCQARAVAGGLSGTYKAWISTTVTPAATRQAHSTVPYMLVNRTRVANDWNGLISGSLLHAINVTELGTSSAQGGSTCAGGPAGTFVSQVWTASTAAGDVTGSTPPSIINTCGDWTKNAAGSACTSTTPCATTGSLSGSNSSWSQACGQTHCDRAFALYCFEQ
jgi:hypothetical protein